MTKKGPPAMHAGEPIVKHKNKEITMYDFFKNKHEETAGKSEQELHEGKVADMIVADVKRGQSPFSLRFGKMYTAALIVKYLMHSLLGIGAAIGIALLFAGGHGANWIVWGIGGITGLIVGLALEAAKHSSQDEFFYKLFYVKTLGVKHLVIMLAAATISTLAVLPAAKHLPQLAHTAPQADSLQLEKLDTTELNRLIASSEAVIAQNMSNKNSRGEIYSNSLRIVKEEKKAHNALVQRRDSMIDAYARNVTALAASVDSANKAKAEAFAAKLQEEGVWSMWLSVILELMLISCAAWIWRYRYGCLTERPEVLLSLDQDYNTKQISSQAASAMQDIEQLELASMQKKKGIGFSIPSKENTNTDPTSNAMRKDAMREQPEAKAMQEEVKQEDMEPNAMRNDAMRKEVLLSDCEHCGKQYKPKVTWQKYCSETCRIAAFEKRTGKKFNRSKKS